MTIAPTITISLDERTETIVTVATPTSPSLRIPLTINGLRILRALLRAKKTFPSSHLGTFANPTQAMIEEFLRSRKLEEKLEECRKNNAIKELF